jgi:hypothetical protein
MEISRQQKIAGGAHRVAADLANLDGGHLAMLPAFPVGHGQGDGDHAAA